MQSRGDSNNAETSPTRKFLRFWDSETQFYNKISQVATWTSGFAALGFIQQPFTRSVLTVFNSLSTLSYFYFENRELTENLEKSVTNFNARIARLQESYPGKFDDMEFQNTDVSGKASLRYDLISGVGLTVQLSLLMLLLMNQNREDSNLEKNATMYSFVLNILFNLPNKIAFNNLYKSTYHLGALVGKAKRKILDLKSELQAEEKETLNIDVLISHRADLVAKIKSIKEKIEDISGDKENFEKEKQEVLGEMEKLERENKDNLPLPILKKILANWGRFIKNIDEGIKDNAAFVSEAREFLEKLNQTKAKLDKKIERHESVVISASRSTLFSNQTTAEQTATNNPTDEAAPKRRRSH